MPGSSGLTTPTGSGPGGRVAHELGQIGGHQCFGPGGRGGIRSGCRIGSGSAVSTVPTTNPPSAVVWLCRPGLPNNPCTPNLTTTTTTPSFGFLGVHRIQAPDNPKIDCFYVYPTVSDQKTPNANLTVDPTERSIALYQAAQYSRDCRVYAPMYRQLTISAIGGQASGAEANLAYDDVRSAWLTYLSKYNHGRGVVLIGHSQGSFVLRQLISSQIDPNPAVRHKLVSAVLMGGNVTVKAGSDVGGDFRAHPSVSFLHPVGLRDRILDV